jgi:hypothetical protein
MKHVFFCHASEDRAAVTEVYQRVAATYPDIKGWMDRYEITGGQDLIEKIASGIEEADRFLVFLSERSINKPWVMAEFRKALVAEIEGKPDFIVPVKLGSISKFPPFIESKRYIDLEALTENEWLPEIYAAITGIPVGPTGKAEPNLRCQQLPVQDEPHELAVVFTARYWAEDIGFRVETAEPILEREYQLDPNLPGNISYAKTEEEKVYAVRITSERLAPGGRRFVMLMKFHPAVDLGSVVTKIERWDGSGAQEAGSLSRA